LLILQLAQHVLTQVAQGATRHSKAAQSRGHPRHYKIYISHLKAKRKRKKVAQCVPFLRTTSSKSISNLTHLCGTVLRFGEQTVCIVDHERWLIQHKRTLPQVALLGHANGVILNRSDTLTHSDSHSIPDDVAVHVQGGVEDIQIV
jgi:hypothetical protein